MMSTIKDRIRNYEQLQKTNSVEVPNNNDFATTKNTNQGQPSAEETKTSENEENKTRENTRVVMKSGLHHYSRANETIKKPEIEDSVFENA